MILLAGLGSFYHCYIAQVTATYSSPIFFKLRRKWCKTGRKKTLWLLDSEAMTLSVQLIFTVDISIKCFVSAFCAFEFLCF